MKVKYTGEKALRHKGIDFYPGQTYEVPSDIEFPKDCFEVEVKEKPAKKASKKED